MSLKSVEMQVALPRTQDAGKLQEQMQQRGQHLQDHALESLQKEQRKQETTVMKYEQKDSAKLHQEEQGSDGSDENFQQKRKRKQQLKKDCHPYKGKVIDYSG